MLDGRGRLEFFSSFFNTQLGSRTHWGEVRGAGGRELKKIKIKIDKEATHLYQRSCDRFEDVVVDVDTPTLETRRRR